VDILWFFPSGSVHPSGTFNYEAWYYEFLFEDLLKLRSQLRSEQLSGFGVRLLI
jgi:hypothetical protein